MRTTIDLFGLELSFSQQKPLTPSEFIKEYNRRVVGSRHHLLCWEQLEELHRQGVLVPFFRFEKNIKALIEEANRCALPPLSLGLGRDATFATCIHLGSQSQFVDPREETYRSWCSQRDLQTEGPYWKSAYFYSPYQLLLITLLEELLPKLKRKKSRRQYSSLGFAYQLEIEESELVGFQEHSLQNTELVIALSALETRYLPGIKGHGYSSSYIGLDLDEINAYRQAFDPVKILDWIGWPAARVREEGKNFLGRADSIDPLRDWNRLVRLCHPKTLDKLRGWALVAVEHRRAAEILLLFYEKLADAGVTAPLEPQPKYAAGSFGTRLKYEPDALESTLMDFGLSPQPSVILIVEGETEDLLVPRVMDLLGIPRDPNLIEVFNSRSIKKDFGLLARYAASPRLGETLENSLLLVRPPTRFMVVVDAEADFLDKSMREKKRQAWVKQIQSAVPAKYRTARLRDDINALVDIETWGTTSFEFTHFSNQDLAEVLVASYEENQSSIADLTKCYKVDSESTLIAKLGEILGNIRAQKGNIKYATEGWKYRPKKTELAEKLWPLLEEQIRIAREGGDVRSIPIARVVLDAWEKAATLVRKDVVIRY